MEHPLIHFISELDGSEKSTPFVESEKITQAAYRAGVTIPQTCGGKGACTDCKILVKNASLETLDPVTGVELRQLGNVFFLTRERLACQAILRGAATILVPAPIHSQRMEKFRKKSDWNRKLKEATDGKGKENKKSEENKGPTKGQKSRRKGKD